MRVIKYYLFQRKAAIKAEATIMRMLKSNDVEVIVLGISLLLKQPLYHWRKKFFEDTTEKLLLISTQSIFYKLSSYYSPLTIDNRHIIDTLYRPSLIFTSGDNCLYINCLPYSRILYCSRKKLKLIKIGSYEEIQL